jgi:hypothetical protein
MFLPTTHITIGSYTFDYVVNVNAVCTWQEQTNTCTIALPAKLKLDKSKLKEIIKKGDTVIVTQGFKGNLNTVFEGFVARVKPQVPILIECEDLMWKLKQITVNDNAKNETLKSFLSRNIPFPIDCFDVDLPKFVAHKINAAQLLDQLNQDYGFFSFIRNGKVTIGKQYDINYSKRLKFYLDGNNRNVIDDNLEYRTKDDYKIKITAISNLNSGEKLEVEVGEDGGDTATRNFPQVTKEKLKELAEEELKKVWFDGFQGDFTAFIDPFVREGDVVELVSAEEPEKSGSYWVDAVTYDNGVNGFRQTIKPGPKYDN